jgi:hypothetical protein
MSRARGLLKSASEKDFEEDQMETGQPDIDDAVQRTFVAVPAALAALVTGEDGMEVARRSAAAAPWLALVRTTLWFRTNRWARFAGLQAAQSGYPAILRGCSITLEAPWLVVSAIMATVGPGTELVAATWERPRPARRSNRRRRGNA